MPQLLYYPETQTRVLALVLSYQEATIILAHNIELTCAVDFLNNTPTGESGPFSSRSRSLLRGWPQESTVVVS